MGGGWVYLTPDGRPIREQRELARLRALAIPPAWTRVWICPSPAGHLQATGRDARGRKQYRYHPRWRQLRDETRYGRMIAFARALPRIRERTERDLRRRGLPRAKVLATVVRLLETTLIRVGNEEHTREKRSCGLTPLRDEQVELARLASCRRAAMKGEVFSSCLRFELRGKSGRVRCIGVRDRRLARVVKACQEIPGRELFQYLDDEGERQTIDSGEVNDYLRAICGLDVTSKDFRTWAGTVLAAWALKGLPPVSSRSQARRNVGRAVERVARRLGSTPAVCRRCYVHPGIVDSYLAGRLPAALASSPSGAARARADLPLREALVLELLEELAAAESLEPAA